jgi:hypothetical protein
MKMAVFWVVAPYSLVEVYRHFRGDDRPDDEGSKHLWNVGKLLLDYTAQQPRRQPSSYSPLWEPQRYLIAIRARFTTYLICGGYSCYGREDSKVFVGVVVKLLWEDNSRPRSLIAGYVISEPKRLVLFHFSVIKEATDKKIGFRREGPSSLKFSGTSYLLVMFVEHVTINKVWICKRF